MSSLHFIFSLSTWGRVSDIRRMAKTTVGTLLSACKERVDIWKALGSSSKLSTPGALLSIFMGYYKVPACSLVQSKPHPLD